MLILGVRYLINFDLFLLRNRTDFDHFIGQNDVPMNLVELV